MAIPSWALFPAAPVALSLSEPARSTRFYRREEEGGGSGFLVYNDEMKRETAGQWEQVYISRFIIIEASSFSSLKSQTPCNITFKSEPASIIPPIYFKPSPATKLNTRGMEGAGDSVR